MPDEKVRRNPDLPLTSDEQLQKLTDMEQIVSPKQHICAKSLY
jgi:hypothetical protein